MASRLRILGVVVLVIGIVMVIGGGYGYTRYSAGADALQGFSLAQNVLLTYNDEGENTDRGTVEGAAAIKALLGDTWSWPINEGELDPNDPLVDTATEYMFQMATIAYHTLHGQQNVALAEQVQYDADGDGSVAVGSPTYSPTTLPEGVWDPAVEGYVDAVFEPGVYVVPVNERYWTQFNRTHPLDGPAREQTWSGTVHGLFAELGVGATTASSLEMALSMVGLVLGLGVVFSILGGGLLWAGAGRKDGATTA
jgi:hypothetical protein